MNEELQALFDADQADRQQLDASVAERDRKRCGRVEELLSADALHAPEDYFHAAILFQHSDSLEDYWRPDYRKDATTTVIRRQSTWTMRRSD